MHLAHHLPRPGREGVEPAPASLRYAIDASRSDLLAAAPLDRLIDAQHQRTRRCERGQEHVQQDATGASARPDGAVQDAMVGLKGRQVTQPDGPQGRADRALAGGEDGSGQQHVDASPYRLREQQREGRQECDHVGG
jgi:hypothetical protein